MFLRSGDAVLMAGEARECFHGKCTLSGYSDKEKLVRAIQLSYFILVNSNLKKMIKLVRQFV